MFALAFILGLLALISARPLIHSQIQNAVARMAKDIDDKYLTSAPKMTLVSGLESGRIAAGKPHELHCDIMGTPIVSIYWTFNGKKIQGSEEIHIDEKIQNAGHPIVESGIVGSRLYLNCPTGKNAGIYKCVGFNGYQKIESTAEIEVEGSSVDCKANRKTAPQIVQWTESRFEMSGNVATLICRANKAADWAWTFDGELIKENDRFEISPRGDLVIKNIEWNDMGSYHCIARNRYGEARQETFLYPTAKRSN